MNYKVLISPFAANNVNQATQFYTQKVNKKVALGFLNDYKDTINTLEKNPFFQIKYKNFRALPFKKFPFITFFEVDEIEKIVLIKGIFHTSQNPAKYP